jgi:hypothetical protein
VGKAVGPLSALVFRFFAELLEASPRDAAFSVAHADADEPTAISGGQDGGSALEQLRPRLRMTV